ncbi:serine/threonine-protein kinase-like protein At3g51990 [Amaranthus tricolor]|uniref:serine/threonine-protein kinase-like protein At3g51990 n=1 Tax=Amaranthus tricolor TaxID=29722 RepID=UPI00258BD2F1|nr:serine/threonine-protein kinase-like protein At3g51990 [Amaranthus tricolor]
MRFLCNTKCAITTCNDYSNLHAKQPFKLKRFAYSDLQIATNNFSQSTILGKGSHGVVYKATLTNPPLTLAVKKLTDTAENEIQILSKIRSKRIVNLIGYAVDSDKILLVVEYMPNGSLYDILHKNPNPPGLLTRVKLALQIGKAVRTLHKSNPPVMHRDIKSSNVLIDAKGNARLGDFGLAIKGHVDDSHVMDTPPAGTLGYLDPCYLAPGDLSTKSDVFSFGIFLLEILSGRKAIDIDYSPPSVVEWALPLIKSGSYEVILDRRIEGDVVDQTVVRELCLLSARCVRSRAEKRPHVSEIVRCLKKLYKRLKTGGFHAWCNVRRRVKKSRPLDDFDGSDCEAVVVPSHGRREAKESNIVRIDTNEEIVTGGAFETVRLRSRVKSNSIGSFKEMSKVGPGPGTVSEITKDLVKIKGQVMVRISSVKLSKSRSMSILYSGKNSKVKEMEVFPLLVSSTSCKTQKLK